jgi:tetratricopeptide (TPR) repeat protein
MQAFQQAGIAAQRATQTTEAAFNAYYNVAAFYARGNDFVRTEQSLRAAISYAPNWFKTHWMLAQVLQAAARLKEAETEAATAVALDGGKHPKLHVRWNAFAPRARTRASNRRTSKILPLSLGSSKWIDLESNRRVVMRIGLVDSWDWP